MLTKADDYPIHQTPEPIAYSGTDRNFYDRYFFNGYPPDGEFFFAAAFGVYPHLNIADASFCTVVDGVQRNLHASRVLNMERMDLSVGPISIDIVEPLNALRVRVDDNAHGIKADILFRGRIAPIEEPRFIHRHGPRTFMDYTRLTQNGTYEGWIEVQGTRLEIAPETVRGTRDRSWGVRPIGEADPQQIVPPQMPQFYWLWAPLNFDDCTSFFHSSEDGSGEPWNRNAVIAPLDGPAAECPDCSADMIFQPGTRHAQEATLNLAHPQGPVTISLKPQWQFYMRGLGYGDPEWRHGGYKGELAVGFDELKLDDVDENELHHNHIQAFCTAEMDGALGKRQGSGVLEQLIMGPHAPSGFTDFMDLAP